MREFGYTFDEISEMTWTQIMFLATGLQMEAREQKAAQRRAKYKR